MDVSNSVTSSKTPIRDALQTAAKRKSRPQPDGLSSSIKLWKHEKLSAAKIVHCHSTKSTNLPTCRCFLCIIPGHLFDPLRVVVSRG